MVELAGTIRGRGTATITRIVAPVQITGYAAGRGTTTLWLNGEPLPAMSAAGAGDAALTTLALGHRLRLTPDPALTGMVAALSLDGTARLALGHAIAGSATLGIDGSVLLTLTGPELGPFTGKLGIDGTVRLATGASLFVEAD